MAKGAPPPLFYDDDGRKCIGLGDYLYLSSRKHYQCFRTVVCVLGKSKGQITELDDFMRKPVKVDVDAVSMTLKEVLSWVVGARRDLEQKIRKNIETFHRDRMLLWLGVVQEFEDAQRALRQTEMREEWARRTIEIYSVRAVSDPVYKMCRKRLLREYESMAGPTL
jgi:hypothetical protein